MAPTEGRVGKPERRWGCRRGTPSDLQLQNTCLHSCCMFVSQCMSLMWQNAAESFLRKSLSKENFQMWHTHLRK